MTADVPTRSRSPGGAGVSDTGARLRAWLTSSRTDQFAQGLEFDRLGDKIEGAQLERADGRFDAPVRGDDRNRQARNPGLDVRHQIQAVAIGQAHVGQAQPITALLEQRARLAQRGGTATGQPHAQQRQLQQLADVILIVDDEHVDARRSDTPVGLRHGCLSCVMAVSVRSARSARRARCR